jgi:UBX domain-containing protein 1
MSKFSSLDSMKKKQEEEEKRQEFYAGGTDARGGGSGLSVLGPPGSGAPRSGGPPGGGDSIADRLVAQASAQGAGGAPDASDSDTPSITLALYRNGFILNEGEFRDTTIPENRQILEGLMSGRTRKDLAELVGVDPNKSLNISLQDKRGEDYTPPPPPAYVAFSGGNSLAASVSVDESAQFTIEHCPVVPPECDESAPNTLIQIRLSNGKKVRAKLNHSHTVSDILGIIRREGGAGAPFGLAAGFPPAPVRDLSATIKDAGLIGAAITQT